MDMMRKICSSKCPFFFLAFASLFSVAFYFAALLLSPYIVNYTKILGGQKSTIRQIKVELIKPVLSTSNHTNVCVQKKLCMSDRHELCKTSRILPYIIPDISC